MTWICANNPQHVFTQPTDDFFCDKCEPLTSLLVERDIDATTVPIDKEGHERKVGLCILLMDASGSMTDQPFAGSPLSRMELIAKSAAAGIFDLRNMADTSNAYILALKFDHRVEQMFLDTVGNLLEKYRQDVNAFADDILAHLMSMQGGTNINKALKAAYHFADQFVNKKIAHFQDYTPVRQRILNGDTMETVTVPNVRVLMYTDGEHHGGALDNPFQNTSGSIPVDILIGAFFGDGDQQGCRDLQSLLSYCPEHSQEQQFFLFDSPSQFGTLRHLFKMASGASGFCPKCIAKHQNLDCTS